MILTEVKTDLMMMTLTSSNVKKAVKTQTLSKRYINTMLRASIINILYHRLNIDDKEFITKHFEDAYFKSFKPKSKNIFIREFHTYMIACKDALEKNYLKEFYLFIIDVATGDILENYKFSFQYSTKTEPPEKPSGDNLIKSTCEMLKNLEDLGKHDKFDAEVHLKVEFTYFDDTPEEYEPPGFRSVDESECLVRKIDKRGNSVVIGTLFTGYHMLKCRGKGEIFNFNASCIEEDPDEINVVEDNVETIAIIDTPGSSEHVIINGEIFTEDLSEKTNGDCGVSSEQPRLNCTYMSNISSEDITFFENCPCKTPDMDYLVVDQIKCEECSRIYHAPCVGFLDKTFLSGAFFCSNCRTEADSISGKVVTHISETRALYKLRLIIGALYKYGESPVELKNDYQETFSNLLENKIFEAEEGAITVVNVALLSTLFNFSKKKPDMGKFKRI